MILCVCVCCDDNKVGGVDRKGSMSEANDSIRKVGEGR